MPALSYRDVLERYDRAKAFGETRTLPDYSRHLNDIYGSEDFNAGLRDGPWTRFSTRADQVLGNTVGQVTGPVGEFVGGVFGAPEAGRRMGEGLPRTLIQAAPLAIPGLGEMYGGALAAGLTGAAFGSQTYADTGNAKAGVISGVAGAAMPYVGGAFGGIGAKLAGGSRVAGETGKGAFSRIVGSEAAGNVGRVEAARFAGSQAGMLGTNVASEIGQDRAQGGNKSIGDVLSSPDLWMNQIPFTVYDAVNHYRAPHLSAEVATAMFKPKPEAPPVPDFTPAGGSDEAKAQVSAFNDRLATVRDDPAATPEEKSTAVGQLIQSVMTPEQVQKAKAAQQTTSTDDTVDIHGRYQTSKYGHKVLVASTPNSENLGIAGKTVFVNGVEPTYDNERGLMKYTVPANQQFQEAKVPLSLEDFGLTPSDMSRDNAQQAEFLTQAAKVAGHVTPDGVGDVDEFATQSPELFAKATKVWRETHAKQMELSPQKLPAKLPNVPEQGEFDAVQERLDKLKLQRSVKGKEPVKIETNEDFPETRVKGGTLNWQEVDPNNIPENLKFLRGFPVLVDKEGKMFTGKGAIAHFDVYDDAPLEKNDFVEAGFFKDGRYVKGSDYFPQASPKFTTGEVAALQDERMKKYPLATMEDVSVPSSIEWAGKVYHGSSAEFDKPQPVRGDVPFVSFTDSEAVAKNYGQNIHEVVVRPKKVWDYKKTSDVEALLKQLKTDPELTDIYGDEAAETDINDPAWERDVRLGKAHAIEVARKQIRDLGYDAFTTIETIGKQGEKPSSARAIHLFKGEDVHPIRPKFTTGEIAMLPQMGVPVERVAKLVNTLPKSGNEGSQFDLLGFQGKIQQDAQGNVAKLGNTDVGLDGWMHSTRFVKATQISPELLPAFKEAYPEAFNTKGEVNATALVKGLKERPMVEVKKLGAEGQSEVVQQLARLQHELDTEWPGWGDLPESSLDVNDRWNRQITKAPTPELGEKLRTLRRLEENARYDQPEGKAKYSITGRLYSLEKISGGLSIDDTLSIKEAVAAHEQAQIKAEKARKALVQPLDDATKIAELTKADTEQVLGSPKPPTGLDAFDIRDAQRVGNPLNLRVAIKRFDDSIVVGTPRQTHADIAIGLFDHLPGIIKEAGFVDNKNKFYTRDEAYLETRKLKLAASIDAGATPTQSVEAARLTTHTPILETSLQTMHVAKEEVQALTEEPAPVRSETGKGQEQNEYEPVMGPTGNRAGGFASRPEAQEWLMENGLHEDKSVVVRNAGRDADGKERGYYIARVINRGIPLDKPTGEGLSLHEAIADASPQTQEDYDKVEVGTRPEESIDGVLDTLNTVESAPTAFSRKIGVTADKAKVILQQAKEVVPLLHKGEITSLEEANEVLRSKSLPEFADEAEMILRMRQAVGRADEVRRATYNMEQPIPHDEKIVEASGIRQSLSKALSWWADLPDNNVMGGLTKAFLKAYPQLDANVDVRLPGDVGHVPHDGWMLKRVMDARNELNVDHLPANSEDTFLWGLRLAHESIHSATADLDGRTDPQAMEFKGKLDEALKALSTSKKLPEKVRKLISRIQKEDHAQRLADKYTDAEGVWDAQRLHDEWTKALGSEDEKNTWFEMLYGLSNRQEMIAQIFGSPEMVQLAYNTRMPKSSGFVGTVLRYFNEAWNTIFGVGKSDSALAHLLTSMDNYLVPQRKAEGFNGRDYIKDKLLTVGVLDTAVASRVKTVEDLTNSGNLLHSISGFQREADAGVLPVSAEYAGLNQSLHTSLLLGAPQDVHKSAMNLLTDELPTAQELWRRMYEDVSLAKQTQAEVKQGNLTGKVNPAAVEGLRVAEAKVQTLRRALDKQAGALQRYNDLQTFEPSGWRQIIGKQLTDDVRMPAPSDLTGLEKDAQELMGMRDGVSPIIAARREAAASGSKMGPIGKIFKLTQFLAEEEPAFKPFVKLTGDAQGDAYKRIAELNFVKNADPVTQELSEGIKNANIRVARNSGLNKLYSDLRRRANVMDKEGTAVTFDDPQMKSILAQASTERRKGTSDREDLVKAFNAENHRLDHRVQVVLPEHLTRMNVNNTALGIIGNEIGMSAQTAFDLSKQLYSALAVAKDPTQVMSVGPMMQAIQAKMTPDTFLKVLGQAQGLIADSEKHLTLLQKYKNYTGEQRYGNYHLVMSRKGESYRQGFGSENEARAKGVELQKQGWTLEDIVPKNATGVKGVADDEVVASMRELDQQASARLQSVISSLPLEQQQQILPLIQRAADYQSSMAAFSPLPTQASPTRKFRAGRGELDMVANANEENARLINWMRHREVRSGAAVQSLDPSILGNRELGQFAQQHVDSQLAPDSPLVRKINEATFYYHLAGNFGVDFLHSIQSLTTGMASMIAETGGVGDALEYVGKATKAVGKRYLPGGQWENDNQKAFINWLTARGAAGLPTWADVFDPNQAMMEDASQPKSTAEAVLNKVKWGIRGYKAIFSKHNDMVLGLAGFQLGIDRGMSFDEAAHFGEEVKNRGNYSGGKNQRGVGFYGMSNRAVPQLFGALQNYTFGWFSQLSHNMKVGFGDAPKGTTETQKLGAKKAFLYQLGAQAILAGGLGLPGVGQGMALLKQTTGYDLKNKSMQWLADAFDEDLNTGGTLTGLAMHGAVADMTAFDPSGRHIPNFPFLGVKPTNGFDLVNLAPASFSTAADLIRGIQAAAKGDTQGLTSALPSAVRGPLTLWQGEGDARDKAGNLITPMTAAEKFITALGLTPSRVQRLKDVNRSAQEASQIAAGQKSAQIDDIATTFRREGASAGQKKLLEFLQANPGEQAASIATQVAQKVSNQTLPMDWREHVNAGADLAGLSASTTPQEVARRQIRQSVFQGLGVVSPMSPKADYQAEQLDSLMNSGLSKAQAVQQTGLGKRRVVNPYSVTSL